MKIFQNLIIKFFIKPLIIIGLFTHFSIIFMELMSDNPIKQKYRKEINNYVTPIFTQSWNLFAPNPINSNMYLLLSFRYKINDKEYITNWIDVSSPSKNIHNQNFFSAAQRLSKFTQTCMSEITSVNAQAINKYSEKDYDDFKERREKLLTSISGHNSLIMYSKSISKKYFRDKNIVPQKIEVKYRIIEAKFPRFSKRYEDYYKLDNYNFKKLDSQYYTIF